MRIILLFVAASIAAFQLSARDFTTTDGTVYKNAKVYSTTPAGVVILYNDGIGPVMRQLFFKDLPPDVQKEFHYVPKQGDTYLGEYQSWKTNLAAKQAQTQRRDAQVEKLKGMVDSQVRAALSASAVKIKFQQICQSPNGAIGWAHIPNPSGDEDFSIGKICILHQTLPQGFPFDGVLYPLENTYVSQTVSTQSTPQYQNYLYGNYYVGSTPNHETVQIPCYAQYDLAYNLLHQKLMAEANAAVPGTSAQ